MKVSLDTSAFFSRLEKLYSAFKESSALKQCDALVVSMGAEEDVVYAKTTSLQTWLFAYELTETVLVFCEDKMYALAGKKKLEFLEEGTREAPKSENLPDIKLIKREREDNSDNFATLIQAIKDSKSGKTIGVFVKDKFSTKFVKSWNSALKEENFEQVDVSSAVAMVMAEKDDAEIKLIRQASSITQEIYSKVFKEHIKNVINDDMKVKHSKVSELMEKALEDRSHLRGADPASVETCYPPIIQSGGGYTLKFSCESNNNTLHFGCIICMFGVRYRSYCSNIVRTIMVNPTQVMQDNYTFLLELEELLFQKLTPGAKLSQVYQKVVKTVQDKKPKLLKQLTKSFGFATGIEFRESAYLINGKNELTVKKGMVFNINIGLSGLINDKASDKSEREYALFVGDIVIIADDGAQLVTKDKKKAKNISIFLKDESSEESEEEVTTELLGRGARNAIFQEKTRQEITAEEKRHNHQRELRNQLNASAQRRLMNSAGSSESSKIRKSNVSYKSRALLPIKEPDIFELKIFIDKRYETVVLPLFGIPTPFHISTIKNISMSKEGDYSYLRINFYCPGSSNIGKENRSFPSSEDPTFIKELTYRAWAGHMATRSEPPAANLQLSFRLIKELQKKFKAREDEEREKEGIVKQDKLVIAHNKVNPKLKDLYIRPNIAQKRMQGHLEAHTNGFRYTSVRGDKVDILYNNIRHAIFQPCDREMIIVLHIHLKNAMIFAKKRHMDVQFYTEVGELTTDLGKLQHMRDRDDLYAEQAERELRKKLNSAFKNFVERVESISKGDVEFDSPFRELSFFGVPFRSTCRLQPTSSALINIVEWPSFVVTLEDIEIVHFERVHFSLKSFDMVFIFKDYKRKVEVLNSIEMKSLDPIREWLNSCDIHYTEGIQSLNWSKILKTILDDPEAFFEQGGWDFLEPEDGDGEDDSEDEESDFNPDEEMSGSGEDGGGGSDEDSDEDYSSEDEDSEDDASLVEDSDSEESGKDWDELEEIARKADETNGVEDDEERRHSGKRRHNSPTSSRHRGASSNKKHRRR